MNEKPAERSDGGPILIVRDQHVPGEPPPHLDADETGPIFYFEGGCGDQWLIWYERRTGRAYLSGGDIGWERLALPEEPALRAAAQRRTQAALRGELKDEREEEGIGTLSALVLELDEVFSLAGALVSLAEQVGGNELAEQALRVVENACLRWNKVYRRAWRERIERGDFERIAEIRRERGEST